MVTEARVREALSAVADPEMPVLTLTDLGILRDVSVDGATVTVTITPTYSGCPAMQEITQDITRAVLACGGEHVFVRTILSPAWTTDWISEEGRRKLEAYGIAPPPPRTASAVLVPLGRRHLPACPRCASTDSEELSRFSSTACRAMWRCRSCREPFDHLKAH